MFELFFKYFWVLGIAAGMFNYFWQKKAVRKYIEEDPQREPGYERMLNILLGLYVIPFALIGAAVMSGELPSMAHFLNPYNNHWLVRAFWIFFVFFWITTLGWMIFGEGAGFFERHPGVLRVKFPGVTDRDRPTAREIRLSAIFAGAIFLLVLTMFFLVGVGAFPGAELPPGPPR